MTVRGAASPRLRIAPHPTSASRQPEPMRVTISTRDSWTTESQLVAARRSSVVAAAPGCVRSGVPDTSHEADIAGPQSWGWPMTDVDRRFSVPTAKAARSTSNPPASAALAQIIHRVSPPAPRLREASADRHVRTFRNRIVTWERTC